MNPIVGQECTRFHVLVSRRAAPAVRAVAERVNDWLRGRWAGAHPPIGRSILAPGAIFALSKLATYQGHHLAVPYVVCAYHPLEMRFVEIPLRAGTPIATLFATDAELMGYVGELPVHLLRREQWYTQPDRGQKGGPVDV